MIKINLKNKFKSGFTIIETMIAISLFTVVMMAGMGALLNANVLHKKSQDMRSIMDNLSFIMEDMSRALRTGNSYHCFITGDTMPIVSSAVVSTPKSCIKGWAIAFEQTSGDSANNDDQWVYYIDNAGKMWKSTAGPYSANNFMQLTPDEVVLDTVNSSFSVLGAESADTGDTNQPFVVIKLVGSITYKNIVTPFSLQTAVSQREIDVGNN